MIEVYQEHQSLDAVERRSIVLKKEMLNHLNDVEQYYKW